MPIELLTIKDLQQFKMQLIEEIKLLLQPAAPRVPQLLKTRDVCKLLVVSAGTLQYWRKIERLGFTKIGGIIFYQLEDVLQLFTQRKKS